MARRSRFILGLALASVGGCAHPRVDLDQAGITETVILSLEGPLWSNIVRARRLPADARPVRVRDLRCVRPRRDTPLYYSCDYRMDYGRDGTLLGTIRRRNWTIQQEADGTWNLVIIVRG